MQRARFAQVLHHQQDEGEQKHRVGQLDQAHPLTVQRRPADFREPVEQRLRVALLQPQRRAADRQQHGKARHHVLEQVRALLPGAVQRKQDG
ncbi:hypothetical protein D3C77_465980 [compost metagenome]